MKLLKNEAKFEILSKSDNIIETIASAARTCYQSQDKASPKNDLKLVNNLIKRGHEAMLEFADLNVKFSNVSRAFSHQMVRHRLCSFAQKSQRWVDESDLHVVIPPHKDENEKSICLNEQPNVEFPDYPIDISLSDWLETNQTVYSQLKLAGWKSEDARFVLPNATTTEIVVGANLREWRTIFDLRCNFHAQWEIRNIMLELLTWCKSNIPLIFDDFHIFNNYARKILPRNILRDEIKHYLFVNPDDTILNEVSQEINNGKCN